MRLDTPLHILTKLKQDLLLEKLTHTEVILQLLVNWRMIKSKDATLGALYDAIPTDMKQIKGSKK